MMLGVMKKPAFVYRRAGAGKVNTRLVRPGLFSSVGRMQVPTSQKDVYTGSSAIKGRGIGVKRKRVSSASGSNSNKKIVKKPVGPIRIKKIDLKKKKFGKGTKNDKLVSNNKGKKGENSNKNNKSVPNNRGRMIVKKRPANKELKSVKKKQPVSKGVSKRKADHRQIQSVV